MKAKSKSIRVLNSHMTNWYMTWEERDPQSKGRQFFCLPILFIKQLTWYYNFPSVVFAHLLFTAEFKDD